MMLVFLPQRHEDTKKNQVFLMYFTIFSNYELESVYVEEFLCPPEEPLLLRNLPSVFVPLWFENHQ